MSKFYVVSSDHPSGSAGKGDGSLECFYSLGK